MAMGLPRWTTRSLLVAFLSLQSVMAIAAPQHDGLIDRAKTQSAAVADAEDILRQAMQVLEVVNKDKVDNPVFNTLDFTSVPGADAKVPAPALPYLSDPASILSRRDSLSPTSGYSIPPALAQAAKVVAESKPQLPKGNHSEVAAQIVAKYSHGGVVSRDTEGEALESRATPGYWMVDDQSHPGTSPYAPAGYKVWRNVKDFGAKGDGVTDDTAAINKAISSGGRCGMNCGSSTIYPAVVYFPPGTYLVSSSIIQYYNTQFLGNPYSYPTILAASSFVGLGVITSDVYNSDNTQWYVNTNNFLRSIRNFKIDIRLTNPSAYVCGIHWQVAQATSLENIEFYALYNSDNPSSTQQGIYMENGSGGFLTNLTFVGGNFGAYFGNQQFTTSHLVFVNCKTAVQVHWDWAWTMQDFIIESCGTGLVVTGGAGSTGQAGVGSLVLTDTLIANTPNAIVASVGSSNNTSLLIQNIGFFNVQNAVLDSVSNKALLTGGTSRNIHSWGIGVMSDAKGKRTSLSGGTVPSPTRATALLGAAYSGMTPNWFTRRRPNYYSATTSQVLNVKALGARGDGKTDDTKVLNAILAKAASSKSIVFFPYGVYIVTDTLKVPINSRIIGQAWSQIMATGANFQNETKPRPAVQVAQASDPGGLIEIQDMLFTVSGPTAGAVLVEWNARESSQGAVGMWDSHFRVGGAVGSGLQKATCPKLTGKTNLKCKAASLLLHLTPKSTAYLENVWAWVADHDMDASGQDQIDIYAGRGILVESAKAWLWGTTSEHSVLYQYELNNATNVLLGMVQTESPYWQPKPPASQPFAVGTFRGDPSFASCKDSGCALAWALRVVNSQSVYLLGAGLYSWFYGYDQACVQKENCQSRGLQVQGSKDVWLYNVNTKAIVEMVTPATGSPTLARDYMNGFMSSMLAWLGSSAK